MNSKYNLVDTKEKLKELDKILMDGDTPRHKLLSYDIESNGLRLYKTTMIGFSISFDDKSGYYVPFLKWVKDESSLKLGRSVNKVKYDIYTDGHLECVWTGEKFEEFVLPSEYNCKDRNPLICSLLKRWLGSTKLIMHNAPFDINHTFINTGVDLKENIVMDTSLLLHILDENSPSALKKAAERYKHKLGIDPHKSAAVEKQELQKSIIINGSKRVNDVWRADLDVQSKYAAADTFLTFGIFKAAFEDFQKQFGQKGLDWFLKKEVMPVCKEVVIDMKRDGIYVDVPYFEKIHKEIKGKMDELEDVVIKSLEDSGIIKDFIEYKGVKVEVSEAAFRKELIKLENLAIPTKETKGVKKETMAKEAIQAAYDENPHWVWGYMLGEDELKYSQAKVKEIKNGIFLSRENEGKSEKLMPLKRHLFNINSKKDLTWLFCEKLGIDAKKLPQTDSATPTNIIPQMTADVLEEHMLPDFPWVSTLLSYKKLLKMESTYIRPVLLLNIDGWMYMDMKQNGTTSGRFSCSGGYNLQTLPRVDDEMEVLQECECLSTNVEIIQDIATIADRKCLDCGKIKKDIPRPSAIKKGFIAPPGYKIVNADYSSLEPRCFAFISNEQALKDVYLKGLDLYSQVYCSIFDLKGEFSADPKAPNFLKKVAKAKRNFIKPIVLAIPYGAEAGQVAVLTNSYKVEYDRKTGETKKVLDFQEGQRIYDEYLSKLTNLKQYMEDMDIMGTTLGYVETIIGRRRHVPYAKKIQDVLLKYGLDYKHLKEAPRSRLKNPTANIKCRRTGVLRTFPEKALNEIIQSCKLKKDVVEEKEYWAYIRALLKNDLNNCKNNPIQGLAASITNKGMLEANRAFRKAGIEAKVCLQIHDEIMCYAKNEVAEEAAKCLQEAMENNEFTALVDLPMIAEPAICDNLQDAK